MTTTYTLIEKITVGAAGATTFTFTNIPQTYTDLKLVISGRGNRPGFSYQDVIVEYNADGNNYIGRGIDGSGSAATSFNYTGAYFAGINAATTTASTFSNTEIYIPNYTGSTYKSASVDEIRENNATAASVNLRSLLWSNTSAITSIKISVPTDAFAQYSTFYLYGVAKEGVNPAASSAPYATGGDSIVFDGTYWIHTFNSSGTFTPKKGLTCDYLVVAGGGGGGGSSADSVTGGGGAGAGGLVEGSLSASTNTSYSITVGAGGNGGTQGNVGSKGSDSIFSIVTAKGGGAGRDADDNNVTISIGGSGGGASGSAGGTFGTSNQTSPAGGIGYGNSGGTQNDSNGGSFVGGGGGGAGSAGSGRTAGNGRANSISGASVTYAAGGYGQGTTNNINAGVSGTANLGNGGNGANKGASQSGGNGGSGIVIVRYPA